LRVINILNGNRLKYYLSVHLTERVKELKVKELPVCAKTEWIQALNISEALNTGM